METDAWLISEEDAKVIQIALVKELGKLSP